MKVCYEVVFDDVVAWNQFHQMQSPTVRKSLFGCLGLGFISLLPLPLLVFMTSDKPFLTTAQDIWPLLRPILLFPFLAVFLVFFFRWILRYLIRLMLSEGDNSGVFGPCSMSLDGDGIRETKESGDTYRKWTAVKRIFVTAAHVFVYTSGAEAFIIPRRAFGGESEFNAFVKCLSDNASVELQKG